MESIVFKKVSVHETEFKIIKKAKNSILLSITNNCKKCLSLQFNLNLEIKTHFIKWFFFSLKICFYFMINRAKSALIIVKNILIIKCVCLWFVLHSIIGRTATTLRNNPINVLRYVFDVACLTVNTILCIDL